MVSKKYLVDIDICSTYVQSICNKVLNVTIPTLIFSKCKQVLCQVSVRVSCMLNKSQLDSCDRISVVLTIVFFLESIIHVCVV